MRCTNPIRITKNQSSPTGLLVPCGKCLACRKQKSAEWALRIYHELGEYNDSVFVTLTYDDDHIPEYESLRKHDLVCFFKRLRSYLPPGLSIKYFACGEYGDITHRPHYHAILFGLGLSPLHKKLIMDNWPKCDWSNDQIRNESFGLAEPASIRYVTGYINKKLSGLPAEELYTQTFREPPFRLSSQGIGKRYVDRNCEQLQKTLTFTMNGVTHQVPRYYLDRLGVDSKSMQTESKKKDCEIVEHYTGKKNMSSDAFYALMDVEDVLTYETKIKNAKKQYDMNLQAKLKLSQSKL